jgi:hypothetical protein
MILFTLCCATLFKWDLDVQQTHLCGRIVELMLALSCSSRCDLSHKFIFY